MEHKGARGAVDKQRDYYSATAADYDAMHQDPEHERALRCLVGVLDMLEIRSLLDVGSGTGRAMEYLIKARPSLQVSGVEPVEALVKQARTKGKLSARRMVVGSGETLPFPSASIDCVCEFAVLHHVKDPSTVVSEMTRVARRMVCLSDENRFGMVGFPRNLVQYLIFKSGQWKPFYRLWTKGKGYQYCPADGVRYSYSVYDSLEQLSKWADRVVLFPTGTQRASRSWAQPLFTSSHVLLCAYRDK